jgi:CheY-like chemotaxis protein
MPKPVQVLYVEDEPTIANLLREALGLFGVRVDPLCGSAEALLARLDDPLVQSAQILFFDIRLPGLTGIELARKLRASGENRPIVFLSAYQAPPDDELANLQARFLPKPFDLDRLLGLVQQLTGAN